MKVMSFVVRIVVCAYLWCPGLMSLGNDRKTYLASAVVLAAGAMGTLGFDKLVRQNIRQPRQLWEKMKARGVKGNSKIILAAFLFVGSAISAGKAAFAGKAPGRISKLVPAVLRDPRDDDNKRKEETIALLQFSLRDIRQSKRDALSLLARITKQLKALPVSHGAGSGDGALLHRNLVALQERLRSLQERENNVSQQLKQLSGAEISSG